MLKYKNDTQACRPYLYSSSSNTSPAIAPTDDTITTVAIIEMATPMIEPINNKNIMSPTFLKLVLL